MGTNNGWSQSSKRTEWPCPDYVPHRTHGSHQSSGNFLKAAQQSEETSRQTEEDKQYEIQMRTVIARERQAAALERLASAFEALSAGVFRVKLIR